MPCQRILREPTRIPGKSQQALVAAEDYRAPQPLLRTFAIASARHLPAATSKFVASGFAEA